MVLGRGRVATTVDGSGAGPPVALCAVEWGSVSDRVGLGRVIQSGIALHKATPAYPVVSTHPNMWWLAVTGRDVPSTSNSSIGRGSTSGPETQ